MNPSQAPKFKLEYFGIKLIKLRYVFPFKQNEVCLRYIKICVVHELKYRNTNPNGVCQNKIILIIRSNK